MQNEARVVSTVLPHILSVKPIEELRFHPHPPSMRMNEGKKMGLGGTQLSYILGVSEDQCLDKSPLPLGGNEVA